MLAIACLVVWGTALCLLFAGDAGHFLADESCVRFWW